jgi:hypothetical protein
VERPVIMRPRVLATLLIATPLALTLAAGGIGLSLRAKRAREWPRLFGGDGGIFGSPYMRCAALSPDGKTLLLGTDAGTIYAWDIDTCTRKFTISIPQGSIYSLEYAPDSSFFAVAHGGQNIPFALRDTATGAPVGKPLPLPTAFSLAFTPSSSLMATAGSEVYIWERKRGQVKHKLKGHSDGIWGLTFSPDEKSLAVGGGDGLIRLWQVESGKLLREWKAYDRRVAGLAFSPDGTTLASVGKNRSGSSYLKIWDARTGKLKAKHSAENIYRQSVVYLPDGRLAYCSRSRHLELLSPDGTSHPLGDSRYYFNGLSVSKDGSLIAAAQDGGIATVWPVPRKP